MKRCSVLLSIKMQIKTKRGKWQSKDLWKILFSIKTMENLPKKNQLFQNSESETICQKSAEYSRKTNECQQEHKLCGISTCPSSTPTLQLQSSLESFQSQIMEKNSSLVPIRGGTTGLELLLSPSLKKLPSFDISGRFHL